MIDHITSLLHLYSHINRGNFVGGLDEPTVEKQKFHEAVLRGIYLPHINWKSCRFNKCSLCYAFLFETNFTEGSLEEVCLRGTRFEEVYASSLNLTRCDFRGASLSSTSFENCAFTDCCFCGVDLRGTSFDNSTFQGCCYNGTKWQKQFQPPSKKHKCLQLKLPTLCQEMYTHT